MVFLKTPDKRRGWDFQIGKLELENRGWLIKKWDVFESGV